jgi:hypothetical protein
LQDQTERAVLRGLDWLRDHQYPDGSWGPHYRTAMTGLALLALFAHGEDTASPDYGRAVTRGLKYLLRRQQNGLFCGGGPTGGHRLHAQQITAYEHAIATYAMAEAYTLTLIPDLRIAMEDAVAVIIEGQHAGGTWDYGYRRGPGAHSDLSLGGWHVQALKAARIAGARNRGLSHAIESAVASIETMAETEREGLFRYSSREPERSGDVPMTAVAVLSLQLTGHVRDAAAVYGMMRLADVSAVWAEVDARGRRERASGPWPFYTWYYLGQARFHQGGKAWVTWNRRFAPLMCAMQNPDGSWGPAPASAEGRFGPVYHTALGALMLEVYYRILPTYREIEIGTENRETEEETGEFLVRLG